MQKPACIAIDGPAGSGKSTIGKLLGQRLGYLYIDTGAMYRAVAWLALQEGVDITDGPALARLAEHAHIVISHPHIQDGRQYTVTVRGRDITWDIRSAPVTRAVSIVSAHPEVRAILIAQQRAMAHQTGRVVMVGRDIGAVVLPDAELKIYLTASLMERARRRYAELEQRQQATGAANRQLPSLEEVVQDIARRDEIDRANLQPAPDAIIIATDNLTIEQVLDLISSYLEDPV
ncbi:MAG TPA: (d)CMP kinase [Ktedonobacteraceae bacterium]|nr:(d)CMP kinase [Ktedonobacteraceae bacterium]